MIASTILETKQSMAEEPKPGLLDYVSASRLKTFHECRLKFYFRYVEQLPSKLSPALHVGKVVHAVLQQWNLRRWRGESFDRETLRPVFDSEWSEQQAGQSIDWKEKEEAQKASAWAILDHYFEQTPVPADEKPEAVEVTVERDFPVEGFPPLLGVIDLVRSGGKIVDFKTAARTPDPVMTEHLNEIQLSCYAVLYREATGKKEQGIELHHLVKTKQPKLVVVPMAPMTKQQAGRLMRSIESYVSGIDEQDYVPSPGQHCAWCDYLPQCRAWH